MVLMLGGTEVLYAELWSFFINKHKIQNAKYRLQQQSKTSVIIAIQT